MFTLVVFPFAYFAINRSDLLRVLVLLAGASWAVLLGLRLSIICEQVDLERLTEGLSCVGGILTTSECYIDIIGEEWYLGSQHNTCELCKQIRKSKHYSCTMYCLPLESLRMR